MELDQSKVKLKAALHGLESAINKLIQDIKLLKQENSNLKAENLSLQQKVQAHAALSLDGGKKDVGPQGTLDMLEVTAVNSIDMSINELKNMVKGK